MITVLACLICFAVGVVLGVAAEWQLLKPWVKLALLQAVVLHGPLKRTNFAAGPDDAAERDRLAHRHQT
jgi:cytochrome bd-type quinol oxidase subunit 1